MAIVLYYIRPILVVIHNIFIKIIIFPLKHKLITYHT